jgi:hypothetical protein
MRTLLLHSLASPTALARESKSAVQCVSITLKPVLGRTELKADGSVAAIGLGLWISRIVCCFRSKASVVSNVADAEMAALFKGELAPCRYRPYSERGQTVEFEFDQKVEAAARGPLDPFHEDWQFHSSV